MKISNKIAILAATSLAILSACDKKTSFVEPDPVSEDTTKTKYIVTVTPANSTGVADYILEVDSLHKGSISILGNGIEQEGTYRYYVTHKNKFFSMLYGQGNPGAVTTYGLNAAGKLTKISNFQSETVQTFAPMKDDIVLIKIPRSGTNQTANFFRVNADKQEIVGTADHDIVNLAGNGERAHFTWATQFGDKLLAPYMSIRGLSTDAFGTSFPDSTWVAVFSYPDLRLEKIIRDNRTASIGAYMNNGLAVDEQGDVYGFSPASATEPHPTQLGPDGKTALTVQTTTKPSAIVRIKKGTTTFDQTYFFNVQEKSGGHHIANQTYIGKGKFMLNMYGAPGTVAYNTTRKLAVVDVYAQTFKWVTGLPEVITSFTTRYNITSDDAKVGYLGVNTPDGNYVYAIDGETAVATRGLKVEGGNITAIQKLKY